MANAENLGSKLYGPDPRMLDRELCIKWQSIKQFLETIYIADKITITPVEARKYTGDLYGLFTKVLKVDYQYLYPHIIANGYDGLNDYDGRRLTFTVLNIQALQKYMDSFTQ